MGKPEAIRGRSILELGKKAGWKGERWAINNNTESETNGNSDKET